MEGFIQAGWCFRNSSRLLPVKKLHDAIGEISLNRTEPILNVGGPSIVALIHAAQLLQGETAEFHYYGARGNDPAGEYLQSKLARTPVKLNHLRIAKGATPSTIVLSDPRYNNGHGERMFVNEIGASWTVGPGQLDQDFFRSDVVVFGGTALVPGLHDNLNDLLIRAKEAGSITVVNTVYDFRSELENPGEPWKLGRDEVSYRHMDLLIMDQEEAHHLSGENNPEDAFRFFIERGVPCFIITNGTGDTKCHSNGVLFAVPPGSSYPVSASLIHDLKGYRGGDTTGCGDNFVGGVLASLVWQLMDGKEKFDLEECISWGTVSGGYCCFHLGGTLIEKEPGEKRRLIEPYINKYKEQIHG